MAELIVPALFSAGVGAVAQGFTWALFGKLFLGNLVLGALSGALNKPKKQNFQAEARDRLHVVRSSVEPRRVIYGEVSVSGPLAYAEATGGNKEYLHLVIPLAGHEVEAIGDLYLNDERVGALDDSGNVTAGRFAEYVRVKKHLGATTQAADADLVAESDGLWTTDHRLQGVAYIYVRLKYSVDVFPAGIPNIQAVVRGRRLYDPRDASTRWSDNWALIIRDYLTADYGLGCDASEVDDTLVAAAANAADEWVAMASYAPTVTADHTMSTLIFAVKEHRIGTGDKITFGTTGTAPAGLSNGGVYYAIRTGETTTQLASSYANCLARTAVAFSDDGSGNHTLSHTAQARYTANGTANLAERPIDILKSMLTAGAGALVWSGGAWKLYAGVFHTPTQALSADDLRGPVSVRARPARKELYNAVRGTYAEPWKLWQPTDWPQLANATYAIQDGGEVIARDIELPFSTNAVRAQRIGKIHLEKSRQGISLEMPCKLTAFKVGVWDTLQVSLAHLGWAAKVFRVTGWKMAEDGGIDLSLQEDAAASYNWASGDATVVDPAPDTALPSPIVLPPPTGLTLASGPSQQLQQPDGVTICRIYATWTASPSVLVGHYEVQVKRTSDGDALYQGQVVSGGVTLVYIDPVISGTEYSIRVRAVSVAGTTSAWLGPQTITALSDDSAVGGVQIVDAMPGATYLGQDLVFYSLGEDLWEWDGAVYQRAEPLVAASRIVAANLAAISADLGSITAGSLNIGGKFVVGSDGACTIRSATTGARLEVTNSVIRVYDSAGTLRVKLGDLSA